MPDNVTGGRALKRKVLGLLRADDFEQSLAELLTMVGRQVINPLFSFLLNSDEKIRWRAVVSMGAVIENLANSDTEAARIVMRRLMWSLNDESGGIGWGAPEVMAEAMTRSEKLADEYVRVFCSYFDEEGNFLEYEVLQRGALWGLVRLARHNADSVRSTAAHVSKYLVSSDAAVRGLAAWAAGILGLVSACTEIRRLVDDDSEFRTFIDGEVCSRRVSDMAKESLVLLDRATS